MIRIPATDGVYLLPCSSDGTYHELVSSIHGTIQGKVSVRVLRQGSTQWESATIAPQDIQVVSFGILLGTLLTVEITLQESSGTGYAEVQLLSRTVGNADTSAKCRVYTQSLARVYPSGVSLVTAGRPRLSYQSIQNRDNQAIYFWHGLVPTSIAQTDYLPLQPSAWTAEELAAAGIFLQTYGEKVDAGVTYAPAIAQTGPLYSFVAAAQAVAHVKVG